MKSEDWCLVYLVRGEGYAGNLFLLRREDAERLCGDHCSKGPRWLFMWTSLSHFKQDDEATRVHKRNGKLRPFYFLRDTGKQDKDFERLGIQKPEIEEMKEILEELGYELKYAKK